MIEVKTKKEGILNSQNNNGMTALHFAVMYRRKEMVQWLTSQGADWYVSNNVGQTPLDILWDSVPSEEESTRVVLIEKQIEQLNSLTAWIRKEILRKFKRE